MIRLAITTPGGRSTFVTDRSEVLVGRREGADLRVEQEGVAPNHCMLRLDRGALTLVDLGSPNGVQFAGQTQVRQARLQPGSAFRIGDVLIEVEGLEAPAAPPPPVQKRVAAAPPPKAPAPPPPPPPGQPQTPIAKGPRDDFAYEIRRKLAAAPWYGISLMAHALILLILSLIPYERIVKETRVNLQSVVGDRSDEAIEELREHDPDIDSLEEVAPEENFDDIIEPDKKQAKAEEAPMDSATTLPENIGFGQPNRRIRPLNYKKKATSLTDGEAKIDRGDAEGEQAKAKSVVSKGFGRGLQILRELPADAIVVVEGEFDTMEAILRLYEIPFTSVTRRTLVSYSLRRAKVLCINCGRTPSALEKRALVTKVRKFGNGGGWIITSDWALTPYLTEAFPTYIRELKNPPRQPDTTVEVSAPGGETSPLIKGVFARRTRTRWWLEEASKLVAKPNSRLEVMIFSEEMAQRYNSGIVAARFSPSRNGRVVHLVGHFFQKDGNRAGVVGMHRLILNFLTQRFAGR